MEPSFRFSSSPSEDVLDDIETKGLAALELIVVFECLKPEYLY
jgi:hypothetical protein